MPEDERHDVTRGLVAGIAGGLAGSLSMSLFSRLWNTSRQSEKSFTHQGGRPDVESAKKRGKHAGDPGSVATTEVADRVSRVLGDRLLSRRERERGGAAVHYAFGMAMGALYGAGVERFPALRMGAGIPFGMLIWAGGVASTLPALRLAAPPNNYTFKEHAFGIGAHVIFGLVTEVKRRTVRALI